MVILYVKYKEDKRDEAAALHHHIFTLQKEKEIRQFDR